MNIGELKKVIESLDNNIEIKFEFYYGRGLVSESDESLDCYFNKEENMFVFSGEEDVCDGIRNEELEVE